MPLSAQLREQLLANFHAEAAEYVQAITDNLLALEQEAPPGDARTALLETIFRAAHNLKGAARAIGLKAVEQLAHALESALADLQHDRLEPSPELYSAMYAVLDAIQAAPLEIEPDDATATRPSRRRSRNWRRCGAPCRPRPGLPPRRRQRDRRAGIPGHRGAGRATAGAVTPAARGETIRVSAAKLDALMDQLGELLVTKIRTEQRLAQLRQAQEWLGGWQKEWLAVRGAYGHLVRAASHGGNGAGDGRGRDRDLARLLQYTSAGQERLRALAALVNVLTREYAGDTLHAALDIDTLEQEIKRVRMLPLATITGSFARMVRDLAQPPAGMTFTITGGHVELDKRVLEQIKDPLIHLLRNAVDHGIELPAERLALGKSRQGNVTLSAEQLGKDVLVRVSDDGAGLDYEALRHAVARRSGASAHALAVEELEEWIFRAGISTSTFITDVSGRGVGLDVVRRNVEALRAHRRELRAGRRHDVHITLPLTLTSTRPAGQRRQLFALPLGAIERILYVAPQDVTLLEGREAYRYDRRLLTLVRLNDVST
jgi:two-component system chemotaxis sensor kinase CheA